MRKGDEENQNKNTTTSTKKNKITSPIDGNNNGKYATSQQTERAPTQANIDNTPQKTAANFSSK